jgi:putative ABC transport system permease protein
MVVGAKGSPLQLVLSSVLHIDAPTGNIKVQEAKQIFDHPFVEYALPVSYGDNYRGYRILGTYPEYVEKYQAELAQGEMYDKPFEVILGANAAERLELKIGDTFVGSHGLVESEIGAHDEHPFTVKGILARSNTVVDQLIITSLESIWDTHAHEEEGHADHEEDEENHDDHDHEAHDHEDHAHEDHAHDEDHDHDEHDLTQIDESKEITSLLVKFKSPIGMMQIPRFINENTNMQSALPGYEVQRLMGLLGSGVKTINGIAIAILLVSGLSIFISLLKTIRERKRELALLRVYGFGTSKLLYLALLEGLFLSLLGFALGWLIGRAGIFLFSAYAESTYGFGLEIHTPSTFEYVLLLVTIVLAVLASFLAAIPVFKLNVAKTLSDE